ncbi:MAG: MBL fold metallo-hydrolase [Bacteroidales bacterium]|nr:MBL fold metallo-hydrolase [Bacteroidales bacterium]
MINIQRFVCNMFQENSYVASDDSGECIIVDCGAFYEEERRAITNYIQAEHLTPKHLVATHGHVDHNFGIDTIYKQYGLQPEIHSSDEGFMTRLNEQAEQFIGYRPDNIYPAVGKYLADGDELTFGTHSATIIHTPGHSQGSVCLYLKDEDILFTGDTLFHLSIGRTDLEGGSMMQIIQSLRHLAQLPDNTVILPGHGNQSTIGVELEHNPFLDR